MKILLRSTVLAFVIVVLLQPAFAQASDSTFSVTWNIDNVDHIAGHTTTKMGDPQVRILPNGSAVWFDGIDDGLIVEANPLEGATSFTVEVVFFPDSIDYPDNVKQRFIHIQNPQNEDRRILIELRVTANHQWYLDTFINSELSSLALMDENALYPVGNWFHAAMVYKEGVMKSYVDGIVQLSGAVDFSPISGGHTSIGTRMDLRSWFKGSIKILKVTHRALTPEEFMITPSSIGETNVIIPKSELLQNYPNPFNPSTTIKIEIPESSHVKLEIYNIEGQEIITLADSHYRAGIYEILWNGRDKNNLQVVSGMYFCRVSSDEHIISNKMLLLK
jgi:hypothetical protein